MRKWYSRKGLWSLFLACVIPIHVWTFILAFSDFEWVAKRTNAADAVAVIAYGLLFALFESILLWLVAAIAGLLVSPKWAEPRRIALLSALVVVISGWAIYEQAHFVWGIHLPQRIFNFALATGGPVRFMYLFYLVPVLLSAVVPVLLILRSDRFLRITSDVFERLGMLGGLYLLIDAAGLILIITRNLN